MEHATGTCTSTGYAIDGKVTMKDADAIESHITAKRLSDCKS